MAWFVSRRNCPSFLTANTVAGPLNGAHRSGRATGDHQDPAAALLLHRRTAHPLGALPHFASAPALALGNPVQSRPRSIASPAISGLTAPLATDPPASQLNVSANSRHPGPRVGLAVSYPAISLTAAIAARRQSPIYPNSSPDRRVCNFFTPLPLSLRRPSVDSG